MPDPRSLQERIIDIMALTGDAADNVPGAPGIGRKTAARLINHGSLDSLLLMALTGSSDHVLTPRLSAILRDNAAQILNNRNLVRLDGRPIRYRWKQG